MPHGGGYQEPLVHPGLTREAKTGGEWLVASKKKFNCSPLSTRH